MSLWAIQVTPVSGRGTPWCDPSTLTYRRRDSWAKLAEHGNANWEKTIKKRKRAGLLRAVKVTIELKETR